MTKKGFSQTVSDLTDTVNNELCQSEGSILTRPEWIPTGGEFEQVIRDNAFFPSEFKTNMDI